MIYEIIQWMSEVRHWFGHDWLYWRQEDYNVHYSIDCRACRYCGETQVHRNGQWKDVNGAGRIK